MLEGPEAAGLSLGQFPASSLPLGGGGWETTLQSAGQHKGGERPSPFKWPRAAPLHSSGSEQVGCPPGSEGGCPSSSKS